MSRRGKKVSVPQAQLRAQRDEIGARMGMLLERYHVLHVVPLWYNVEWYSKPLIWRMILTALGKRPDVDAIVQERMEELDSLIQGQCPAMKHEGQCQLQEGHEGPHQRQSFGDMMVEWDDDESDGAEE